MSTGNKTCPSSTLAEDAVLLGLVNENNEIDFIENKIIVNNTFVAAAQNGTPAEQRFRFANKCVKSGCSQWTGSRCGVIDEVLNTIEEKYWKDTLPNCSIRDNCRWFSQNGANACKVCSYVITDTMAE